jgi:hypothetical protein
VDLLQSGDSVGGRTGQIIGQTLLRGPTGAVGTTALPKKSPMIGETSYCKSGLSTLAMLKARLYRTPFLRKKELYS